ncbi:41 helicase [uncultured Caudovirales phage]|uniref:DnaB-like replicative helicase n=1 Tax=uncultured Caudovirales phage TaxID=2100421 RepID=A0A6J5M7X2_9CAUD|nr:41 helicase [uncultured Caudovirales phage]
MNNDKIEILILSALMHDDSYCRKVLPFIKGDYFSDESEKIIYQKIESFIQKYDNLPSKEALLISLSNDRSLIDSIEKSSKEIVSNLSGVNVDAQWLLDQTEEWCKDRAIYLALMGSIKIADDKKGKLSRGVIPKLLTDALSVSFDPNVGHSYLDDTDARYEFYHRVEEKLPFDLECMNKITKNGVPRKTLNVILAGTAVGKSLALCHMAASYFMQGKNVLYITLEMAEARIAERIDANLLNVSLQDLQLLTKDMYDKKIKAMKSKAVGRMIIKEYPTATASVTHFRSLLNELSLKKNFVPDVIFVDYLNIATSARLSNTNNINSYTYVKSIAEEFRGLAVEYNIPLWTATQTNRQGYTSSDIGLENTSESFGLPATADFLIALSTTEELEKMGQILVKQLKNRYNDISKLRRFVLGIDRSKMRLFDLDESAQEELVDVDMKSSEPDVPAFDKSRFGSGMKAEDDIKW